MKTIALFCGAGGATDGMVRAGLDVQLAVDGWQAACIAHRRWHPAMPVVRARVEDAAAIYNADVDIVWASPSCKPYSMANRTPLRGRAHPEFYDLALLADVAFGAWRARWLIVENVCGLLWSKEGAPEVERLRLAVERHGRRFSWSIVNSNTVGVAQIRRRFFMVAGPDYVRVPHGLDYIAPANAQTPPMACEGTKGSWERQTRWPKAGNGCVANEHGLARSRMTRERWGEAQRAVGREDRRTAAQIAVRSSEHLGGTRPFRDTQGRTLAECCALQMVPEHVVAGFSKRVAHELVGNAVPFPLAEHVVRHVLRAAARLP